jgi:hypothetical protein
LANFDLEIVLVGAWPKLDLLDLRRFLMTPTLVIFFAQLKFILPIIHDAANRRLGRGSDFNEIVAPFLSLVEGLCGRQYSQLLAFGTDDANLPNPDFPVNA